ncbi:MAG: NAD-dependent epimerase/dehydratase family protein [Chitinophagales bacterium]|jgi:hypothetical protein|nr:NAD-dependent epimerase/dehydratase family protein [Chitinophagales bacterium]
MEHKKLLIAGGTGFIGRKLMAFFASKYQIYILSTNPSIRNQPNFYFWLPEENRLDIPEKSHFDVIINLSGANIAEKFWTKSRKETLIHSRIQSTRLLKSSILEGQISCDHFIQASATGYYGDGGLEMLDENSQKGQGFLSDLCHKWELEAKPIAEECKLSIMRIPIIMDLDEGFLPNIRKTICFKFNLLFGGGSHYITWSSSDDLCLIVSSLIESPKPLIIASMSDPIRFVDFTNKLADFYGKSLWNIKIPAKILETILGDFSELMLYSQRCESQFKKEISINHMTINDFLKV